MDKKIENMQFVTIVGNRATTKEIYARLVRKKNTEPNHSPSQEKHTTGPAGMPKNQLSQPSRDPFPHNPNVVATRVIDDNRL